MAPYCTLGILVCWKTEAIPVPKFFMSISTRHVSFTIIYFMPDMVTWLATRKAPQALGLLKLAVLGIFDLSHASRQCPSHIFPFASVARVVVSLFWKFWDGQATPLQVQLRLHFSQVYFIYAAWQMNIILHLERRPDRKNNSFLRCHIAVLWDKPTPTAEQKCRQDEPHQL